MCSETATLLYYSNQDISGIIAWGVGEAVKAETPAGHYNFKNNKWKILSAETFN